MQAITDAAAVVILLIIKHRIQWYKLYDHRMLGNEGVPVNKHQGWRNSPTAEVSQILVS